MASQLIFVYDWFLELASNFSTALLSTFYGSKPNVINAMHKSSITLCSQQSPIDVSWLALHEGGKVL